MVEVETLFYFVFFHEDILQIYVNDIEESHA
jgi:hypothetical protein